MKKERKIGVNLLDNLTRKVEKSDSPELIEAIDNLVKLVKKQPDYNRAKPHLLIICSSPEGDILQKLGRAADLIQPLSLAGNALLEETGYIPPQTKN